MRCYFAPLEGVTDSIYRRLHQQYFPGADRYYTPFFSPTVHRALTPRESRELPPAHVWAVETVPQLLTKVPEDFIWMSQVCRDLGYQQVNLNLGCPSGTVTAKGKGAGMLRQPELLDAFLEQITQGSCLPVSVKTRLGFTQPEEFYTLLEIFNRHPIVELTIHPRVRQAFYDGQVDTGMFAHALRHSAIPLCYNGDIATREQALALTDAYPQLQAVMIGRGLVADPGMLTPGGTTKKQLERFLEALFEEYAQAFGSTRNAMFRLKENWRFLFDRFQPDPKLQKQLKKTTNVAQYKLLVKQLLADIEAKL